MCSQEAVAMAELRKQDPDSLPTAKCLFCFSGENAPRIASENTAVQLPVLVWCETVKWLSPLSLHAFWRASAESC